MKHILILLALTLLPLHSVVAQSTETDPVVQELIRLEHAKDKAYESSDKLALDRLYADDYQAITSTGVITSKKTLLDFFVRPHILELHRSEELAVRLFGDVALLTGVQKRKFHKEIRPGGEDTLRYTNVYAKREGTWRIVAAQYSPVQK